MFQKISLIGNLGNDPELRYLASGEAVTNFSVATNRRWITSDGEKAEETTWFRISVWGKSAEACNQYLEKGRQVFVEGTLQPDRDTGGPRIWDDSEGNPRTSFEVRAQVVQFLSGGNSASPSQSSPSSPDAGVDEMPF